MDYLRSRNPGLDRRFGDIATHYMREGEAACGIARIMRHKLRGHSIPLDLIEPVKLQISLNDREQYALEDYYTISEERLASLRGAGLERLHVSGYLRPAYSLLASLPNISRLIELKNRRRAAAAG